MRSTPLPDIVRWLSVRGGGLMAGVDLWSLSVREWCADICPVRRPLSATH